MNHNVKINSMQLVASLLVCRFFTMLVAVPNSRSAIDGSSALLLPFVNFLAMLLLGIPLLFLMKRFPQCCLSDCAAACAPNWIKPLQIWQLLFCLITAIGAASQSEYFVTTALYPQAELRWVILLFVLVVWYMVAMGIEAISRVSLIVCGLIVLSSVLIFTGVFRQLDWLNIGLPFYEPPSRMAMAALAYWGQNVEVVLLVIFQPFSTKARFRRDFLALITGGLLITGLLTFFTTAVLGLYGKTRMFPVYTLASLSGHGFFSRLDYLHIINWTFACLLRCGLFAYGAYILLQKLLPKRKKAHLRFGIAALIFAATLAMSHIDGSYQWFYLLFATGVPVLVSTVLIPLLLLWKSRKRRKKA